MRSKIIIGNWKMNKSPKEAVKFVKDFHKVAFQCRKQGMIIGFGVPYICLPVLAKFNDTLVIAAQNCHYKENGAFTGEVSAKMLDSIGICDCIVGHSERRSYYNETTEECNKKIIELLRLGMYPIYCVGESLDQYEKGISKEVVKEQVLNGLKDVVDLESVVIAYEPVWSIGTGKSASVDIAEDMCKFIRETIREEYGAQADKLLIQYGGSVKPNNVKSYIECENIDGVLVGGASLDKESFLELIKNSL